MKKTMIGAGLSALALLTAGAAVAQTDGGRPDRNADITRAQVVAELDAQFAKLDTNRDGNISATEQKGAREARFAERFKRLDTDGNGSVSQAEFAAAREKRGEARGERAEGRGGHHGGRGHFGFGGRGGNADANKDGVISKAQVQAKALERFHRGDNDRNGVLTAPQRQQARAAMEADRGP